MRGLLLIVLIGPAWAGPKNGPVVEVFMPEIRDFPIMQAFAAAEVISTKVYAEAGIDLIWPLPGKKIFGCSAEPFRQRILVNLVDGRERGAKTEAIAYATLHQPQGACITIRIDLLKRAIRDSPKLTPFFLAHILSHEICHVVEGIARHSDRGIMRAGLSDEEAAKLYKAPLQFAPHDIELMRAKLGERATAANQSGKPDAPSERVHFTVDAYRAEPKYR